MGTDNSILRLFLTSRRRGLIVIIVTCLVGLVTIWPAVDEYLALVEFRENLSQSLAEARADAQGLVQLERQAHEQTIARTVSERRAISGKRANEFRNELVEIVHGSGCHLRQGSLEQPSLREWRHNDDPLGGATLVVNEDDDEASETQYQLSTQSLILSVSGSLGNIGDLLAQLEAEDKLMHVKDFSLQPVGDRRRELILKMEIQLFDLQIPAESELDEEDTV